ncbi:MAG: dephospho-CoA kinase, partial [Alphaproteobacteria bacterium]|nr:dephospho-CoA kinase [Alphaproteobacteria bacterium]
HPLVRRAEVDFVRGVRKKKGEAVILEIPLLFETGADKRCDATLCVTAPRAVQKVRVMARPGMTNEKFRAIMAAQMPDKDKRARADFVIPTGKNLATTARHICKALEALGLCP